MATLQELKKQRKKLLVKNESLKDLLKIQKEKAQLQKEIFALENPKLAKIIKGSKNWLENYKKNLQEQEKRKSKSKPPYYNNFSGIGFPTRF